MWSEKPAAAETQVGRYWDDLVTGAAATTDIEPSLQQTIAWLERIDDAQPAGAEFSRRFESQFLQSIGVAPAQMELSSQTLVWRPKPPVPHPSSHRGLFRAVRDDESWRRLLIPLAAAAVLIVSLVAIYYAFERREEMRDSNVILAPSSSIDVPMDRGDAARSGVMPGPGIENGLESKWRFEAGRSSVSAPAVVDDTVFITSGSEAGSASENQGAIIAIDASTGSERWRFPTEFAAGTTPAIAHGNVYAGDTGGVLYALDAGTGQELWRTDLQSGWTSSPVVVNDTVYVAAAGNRAALHVAVEKGTVVVGSGLMGAPENGFQLYAFDRTTGEERWHSGDDHSGQPGLFTFDADTGELAWNFEMASLESGPAISGQRVYAGSTLDGNIYALDISSGAEEWSAPIGEDLSLDSAPAISGGSVFITTAYGSIVCLDGSTGAERWRASAENISLNGSAIVVDSAVYVVDTNWGVSAFSAVDGSELWSQQLDLSGQAVVPPVIADGTLYIGTSLEADSAYVATLWAFTGSGDSKQAGS
jgi:outer membrane protein assembly factor BamB